MLNRIVFLYYILCYSAGLAGLLLSILMATALKPSVADRRFAFLSASFACIVIPYTAFAYLESSGSLGVLSSMILAGISFAGDSSLVFFLPFFMSSFPSRDSASEKLAIWKILAMISAVAATVSFIWPPVNKAIYIVWASMIAAILNSSFVGYRIFNRKPDRQGASAPDRGTTAEDGRWTGMLRAFSIGSACALPMLVFFDFFPNVFAWKISGYPFSFHFFPLLYAFINLTYIFASARTLFASFDPKGRTGTVDSLVERSALAGLSARETEVAELLASGASYKELCWELRIRMGTARSHVSSVYRKLGVNCKEDLMRLARGE